MFLKYKLQPVAVHDPVLDFEWDADSGEVRGPDAQRIRTLTADAVRDRVVIGSPYPTAHDISDPLRRKSEMAVVLGNYWMLSGDLLDAYPVSAKEKDAEGDVH